LDSRKKSWYSWDVLSGLEASFWMEKWIVFTPVVEASVPVTETGRSSARRKPVWTFVEEGVKIDLSFTVTSTALVVFLSNLVVLALLPSSGVETLTREVLVFGNRRTSLHFRSVSMLEFESLY